MKSAPGFTLIEVVIVIAISALVMGALSNIFVTFNNSYAYQNAIINASASATLFLNEMSDYSLQADAIVSSRAFSGTTYTTGSTTVVFELPAINSSGDIISSTYDYVVLFSSSTKIYRIMDANGSSSRLDGTKQLTDVLQNLTLAYDSGTPSAANSIMVNILNSTTTKGKTAKAHLRQTLYLRNK